MVVMDAEYIDYVVAQWARLNCPQLYYHCSPQVYFGEALRLGVITQTQHSIAKKAYRSGWYYANVKFE